MEVEFVEDVGLTAAAPQSIAVPPPPSQAPEIGEAEPVEAGPPPSGPTPAPTHHSDPGQAAPAHPGQARAARVADRR